MTEQELAFARVTRQSIGLGIYRFIANFLLMVIGFRTFPSAQVFVALAIITFNLACAGSAQIAQIHLVASNQLADAGERKSRHAIITAQRWALRGEPAEGAEFWGEVDRDVAAERVDDEGAAPGFWKSTGLVAWNFGSRVAGDLLGVAVALAFAQ